MVPATRLECGAWTQPFRPGSGRTGAICPGAGRATRTRSSSRELMLQQTQVERVIPRWLAWLERWPTVEALAAASPADAIREWQGLGYNRRALALHRAACADRRARLAGRPHRASRGRPLHGRRGAELRLRRGGASGGRERAPRAGAHGARVRARARGRADGSRRHGLPRAGAALRRVPARARVSLAGTPLRAAAQAVARSRARSASAARRCCASSRRRRGGWTSWTTRLSRALSRDGLVRVEAGLVALPT